MSVTIVGYASEKDRLTQGGRDRVESERGSPGLPTDPTPLEHTRRMTRDRSIDPPRVSITARASVGSRERQTERAES